jgi:hypothetical protein
LLKHFFNKFVKKVNTLHTLILNCLIIFTPMLKKRLLGLFFILLFSFQLAPIQQVGSFLCSNQMTEEIPHGTDEAGAKNPDDSLKHFYYSLSDHGNHELLLGSILNGMAVDVKVKSRSSDDIQTPPPNFIA